MFAIFTQKKQISEQVSSLDLASQLLKLHKKENPNLQYEIRAKVKRINKDGMISITKKRKAIISVGGLGNLSK